jgi:hypothetical protein
MTFVSIAGIPAFRIDPPPSKGVKISGADTLVRKNGAHRTYTPPQNLDDVHYDESSLRCRKCGQIPHKAHGCTFGLSKRSINGELQA